jgi:hypothetical protein
MATLDHSGRSGERGGDRDVGAILRAFARISG